MRALVRTLQIVENGDFAKKNLWLGLGWTYRDSQLACPKPMVPSPAAAGRTMFSAHLDCLGVSQAQVTASNQCLQRAIRKFGRKLFLAGSCRILVNLRNGVLRCWNFWLDSADSRNPASGGFFSRQEF